MCHVSTNWYRKEFTFLSFFFFSFCGKGKFLLLLTVLRNLDNKQGILSKFRKLTRLNSRPQIASYCTN